jgi:DNA-binding GntR family transcriptional regulator
LNSQIPEDAISVESRLAEQIGISRTPIREAFHFLEKDSLMEIIPRAICRLRKIDWDEFEEIVEIRKRVDALAAKGAIQGTGPSWVLLSAQSRSYSWILPFLFSAAAIFSGVTGCSLNHIPVAS